MMKNIVKKRIMWGDLDSLGIVFYPRYYEWIDGCAHLFFDLIGLNMNKLWKEKGVLFGLVETGCKYHFPGRYHQDIEIHTFLGELGDKTVLLRHNIFRDDGMLMVEGFERRICMDVRDTSKFIAIPIPPDIRNILQPCIRDNMAGP
jgi:YbgC/YbaW family acyl-CoA thioester hydrolase